MASLQFTRAITGTLRSRRSAQVYATIDLDVWIYVVYSKEVTSEQCGHHLYKNDFTKLKYLPDYWWYHMDIDGNGILVDFPLKAKPMLFWSPKNFVKTNGGMVEGKRFPIEKVSLINSLTVVSNNKVNVLRYCT